MPLNGNVFGALVHALDGAGGRAGGALRDLHLEPEAWPPRLPGCRSTAPRSFWAACLLAARSSGESSPARIDVHGSLMSLQRQGAASARPLLPGAGDLLPGLIQSAVIGPLNGLDFQAQRCCPSPRMLLTGMSRAPWSRLSILAVRIRRGLADLEQQAQLGPAGIEGSQPVAQEVVCGRRAEGDGEGSQDCGGNSSGMFHMRFGVLRCVMLC